MAFLLDDILMAPGRGIMWIFQQVQKAADASMADRTQEIRDELSALYQALEKGEVTPEQFDQREAQLLDELEAQDQQDEPGDDEPPLEGNADEPKE